MSDEYVFDPIEFGKLVRIHRERAGMNIREASIQMGVAWATLQNLETGKFYIHTDVYFKARKFMKDNYVRQIVKICSECDGNGIIVEHHPVTETAIQSQEAELTPRNI